MPDGQEETQQPQMPQGQVGPVIDTLLSMLSGAGLDRIASAISKLSSSGVKPESLLNTPNLRLLIAGAGFKDMMSAMGAQSESVLAPVIGSLIPKGPPKPEPPKPSVSDILPSLTASLGPRDAGLVPGMPGGGGIPGLPPPPGI